MKIFNTEFEVSMRLLLLLDCLDTPADEERLLYLDFMSVNAKNYKFANENLNGDGLYMLNELTLQHSLIKKSIKSLVINGLIKVVTTKKGFFYSINEEGKNLCDSMCSDYAFQYKANASIVCNKTSTWTITKFKQYAKEMEARNYGIY